MVRLPPLIERLFWDANLKHVSIDLQRDFIIERVLNMGTLADWRWLVDTYGDKVISERCEKMPALGRENLRPESRRLASLLLR